MVVEFDSVARIKMVTCILLLLICGAHLGADSSSPGFDYVVETAVSPGDESKNAAGLPSGRVLKYGVGSDGGVWVSLYSTKSWENRSAGLPVRVIYPFDASQHRRIENLTYNPLDPARVAVATADRVFVSEDAGAVWREIKISNPVKSVDHITAVCVSPRDPNTIYLGTSFSGYFKSSDGGVVWRSQKESIPHLFYGAGFYETIAAIGISPADSNLVYLAAGIGGDVYESENGGKSWRPTGFPGGGKTDAAGKVNTRSFIRDARRESWLPRIHTNRDIWIYSPALASWRRDESYAPEAPIPPLASAKALRTRIAVGRTGIYVNPARAAGNALKKHLDLLAEHGMDTIVVDMKDDTGRLTYDTDLTLPNSAGAVDIRFSLNELLGRAHDAGVYVVGRIVVFQDPKLYAFDDNAYAVRDSETGMPWRNLIRVSGSEEEKNIVYEQREFWVDPYSEFVWLYNVAIAEELERRGVDEVQFDYIRFPSDGDTSRIDYRFKRKGMNREDAIESFLKIAREKIGIPISADLYGFNAWYLMGGWIGQNIDMIADYVDVVCPMFYPSHFPGAFLSDLAYFDRAEAIYLTGSNRAVSIVGERSVVRPYVQAFLIGAERGYEAFEYSSYLARQLGGVVASNASGFTLWNASNIYYMVTESLKRFTGG